MSNQSKLVVNTYDKVTKQYQNEFGNDYSDVPYIDKFLDSLNGKQILDIGCGLGNLTNYMYQKGFEVTGIDLSDKMLQIAKSTYKNISFEKMDMKKITFNKKFDGISLLYSLFHLTKEEVINVLPQYRNLLNKNGKIFLILQDGNGEQVVKEPLNKDLLMFVNYYSLDEITKILKDFHFRILYTTYKKGTEGSLSNKKLVILCEKES